MGNPKQAEDCPAFSGKQINGAGPNMVSNGCGGTSVATGSSAPS